MDVIGAGLRYLRALNACYTEPPDIPALSMETTNTCNSDCVFCPNSTMQRPRMAMPMPIFERAIKQFAAMGGKKLDLTTVIGEPLLDPLLLKRLPIIRRHPHISNIGFLTTLQHLHRFDINSFVLSGLEWITISTTIWGKKDYERFFGVPLYHQTMKNIETLLMANARHGYPVRIYFSLKSTGRNTSEILSHPDFKRIETLYGPGLTAAARQLSRRADDWNGHVKLPSFLEKKPFLPRAFTPCKRLYEGLRVFSDGKVGACACRDFEGNSELILGHTDSGLHRLWRGEGLSKIRRRWRYRNQIPAICKRCRDYQYQTGPKEPENQNESASRSGPSN